jgi:sulfite reductase beta subunit-like hemoprotein
VAHHFLYNPISQRLPRKVKIAVSGSERDSACAALTTSDLSRCCASVGGIVERGFRVLVGGGLGASPEAAHLLYDFIPTERMLPVLQAIVRVFDREGDRQNRNRARLKFVLRRAGIEQFRIWVDEMLTKLPTRISIAYQEPHPICATGSWANSRYLPVDPLWVRNHVKAQRQSGFVSVLVWLPCGDVMPQQLHTVATAAQRWGDGEVRTTPTQNLLLRWVRRENLPALYDLLSANGLTQPCGGTIADVTSCPGSKTCQVGVTHSRALAESLMEELQGEEADEDLKGATIKISGCPHACSQHHVATIGFYGASKKLGGKRLPTTS